MDITQFFEIISSVPFYVWIIIGIVLTIIFGDREIWEYEAEFPYKEGLGRGEVEIECYKRKGAQLEAKLYLEPNYNNRTIEIHLNNNLIATIPENKNVSSFFVFKTPYTLDKPNSKDQIDLKINNEVIFSGNLIKD